MIPSTRIGSKLTLMRQMLSQLPISMAPRRDMEISLHLVPFQTAINPTSIRLLTPTHTRSLCKLASRVAPHFAHNMVHMRVLLLRAQPISLLVVESLVLVRSVVTLVHPQLPGGVFALEKFAGEDAVAGGVLDVDAERVAGHVDDDVEVELELVRDTFFHAEVVLFGAAPPCFELVEAEESADGEDEDGPLAAAGGRCCIGWFGFS